MRRSPQAQSAALVGILILGLVASVAIAAAGVAGGSQYAYDQPGDKQFVNNTAVLERAAPGGANNQSYKISASRAQVKAAFTNRPVIVDGIREATWDAAISYPIRNRFNAGMTADAPDATAHGDLRLLWDGPVLYLLVEVTGDTTQSVSGGLSRKANCPPESFKSSDPRRTKVPWIWQKLIGASARDPQG